MKKTTVLFLVSFAMMFLISCANTDNKKHHGEPTKEPSIENEIQEDIFRTIQIMGAEGRLEEWDKKTGVNMANMTYPYFTLKSEDAKKYPKLQEALLNCSEAKKESQFDTFELMKKEAYEEYAKNPEYLYRPFEAIKQATVRRADSKVVSILFHSVTYWGGMHGDYFYWGENYDSKTGKKLELSDVVNRKENLADLVQEQLDKFYWDTEFFLSMDLEKLIQEEKELSWTIDYNGLTFYFSPYVIAASVTIPQIVTLSFEEYPELVKEEYCKGFSSYSMEVENDVVFYCDVTGDDVVDRITCSVSTYGGEGSIRISLNNEMCYREDVKFESAKIAMTYAEGGECLLFVEVYKDNSRCETIFYKLTKTVAKVGTIKTSLYHMKYQKGELWKTYDVFTKPEAYHW